MSSIIVHDGEKQQTINVGQDSATTHGFNSADISAHICIINILWLVDVLICVTTVRVSLLAHEWKEKKSSLCLVKVVVAYIRRSSNLYTRNLEWFQFHIPSWNVVERFEQPEFAGDSWQLLNMLILCTRSPVSSACMCVYICISSKYV